MAGMKEFRQIIRTIAVLTVVLFVAMLIYFGAYLGLGRRVGGFRDVQTGRTFVGQSYDLEWQAKLFVPAAAVESFLFHKDMVTGTREKVVWRSTDAPATP